MAQVDGSKKDGLLNDSIQNPIVLMHHFIKVLFKEVKIK